ncbi:Alpha/Beta hydrolase protein [Parasitella parasitica]|nr:Alpha/Beta hydrolase protein [Parasitella parasitica]
MILQTFKWVGLAIFTSYLVSSSRRQTTLGSLADNPSGIFTPDFYPNGTDLELPQGTMRYWKFGNEDGNRVVLIHGISTGSAIYDKLARDLADNGHHVLVYDLWGRGYAQAPAACYDEALYTSQLAMLLQKVGWKKTDVVGTSLGGGIATSFTAFYPEMVNKLVLLAPAGLFDAKEMPLMSKVVNLPFVHNFIVNQPYVRPLILTAIQRFAKSARLVQSGLDVDTEATISKITEIATYQFLNHPGFLRAFLGTVVDFPFTTLKKRYEKIGKLKDKPVLLIWGDKDTIVPFYHSEEATKLVPQAKLVVFKDQGHDVLITKWKLVDEEIETFLMV